MQEDEINNSSAPVGQDPILLGFPLHITGSPQWHHWHGNHDPGRQRPLGEAGPSWCGWLSKNAIHPMSMGHLGHTLPQERSSQPTLPTCLQPACSQLVSTLSGSSVAPVCLSPYSNQVGTRYLIPQSQTACYCPFPGTGHAIVARLPWLTTPLDWSIRPLGTFWNGFFGQEDGDSPDPHS